MSNPSSGYLASVGDDPGANVETAASAVASREKAAVEARYIMALKRPRDMDEVRVRLLKECGRPGFAEVAKYEKPVGGQKIVGFSVRFAETAIRLMTNIAVGVLVVFDDERRRVLRVSVTDLESNVPYEQDVTIEKTVERRAVPKDRDVIGQRTNTSGQTVYIVSATEDEFANKQNAAISKVLRNHGLRLIPGDILEECSRKLDETYDNKAATDPNAERKKVVDAFAAIGITPKQLAAYLEHPLEQVVPAELTSLRRIYQSIRDGETTWMAVMEEKFGEAGETAERPRPQRKSDAPKAEEPKQEPADTAAGDPASDPTPPVDLEPAAPTETSTTRELPSGSRIVNKDEPAKAPNGNGGKLDPSKLTPLYRAQRLYNESLGDGAAQKLLQDMCGTEKLSGLTNEQADEYLAALQDGAR